MSDFTLPILATLALWWGSTGAIVYVDNLPQRTYRYTIIGATVLVGFAFWGLVATADETTVGAAYGAFSYGLICWGWQIVSYYTGYVSGPRREASSPGLRGLSRFVEALRTSLYHEMAALAGAALLLALTYGKVNQLGFWTYVTLWWMHESAKLNLFFGVPNFGEEMLPEHLRFLSTYMTRRSMNMFFPVSVTVSTIVAAWLANLAFHAQSSFERTGFVMLCALMALAVAEHWFLVVPMNANALWGPMSRRSEDELSNILAGEFAALDEFQPSVAADSVESWSVPLPPICDLRNLRSVLELIASGAFGDVDAVKGATRTRMSWVAFEINGRGTRMTPFAPRRLREPLIVATGRGLDRQRLAAMLESCAA